VLSPGLAGMKLINKSAASPTINHRNLGAVDCSRGAFGAVLGWATASGMSDAGVQKSV